MTCLLTCLSPAFAQTAIGVAEDSANNSWLLWSNPDTSIALWKTSNATGALAANYPYGPFPGWTPLSLAVGPDNHVHILWNHSPDNQIALWDLAPGAAPVSTAYGPYSGYTAAALAIGPDNHVHVLWNYQSGSIALWDLVPGASPVGYAYAPPAGDTATALAAGPDNHLHVLWSNASGNITLWDVLLGGTPVSNTYGPYAGYTALALSVGPDDHVHVLWNHSPDNQAALWDVNLSGTPSGTPYGPYAGYIAKALSVSADNRTHVVWNSAPGQISLWSVNANGAYTFVNYPSASGLTLNAVSVPGGTSVTGTVTLNAPAGPGGAAVALSSSNASTATVPSSVMVPAGQTSITFMVSTVSMSATTSSTITASYNGASQSAALNITPALPNVGDLSTYATGSGKITLYWTRVANATGFNIYRGTISGGEDYAHPVNGSTPINTASYSGSPMDMYSNTGLTNGAEYFYTVKAVYSSGQSQTSNEDSDIPDVAAVPWDTRNPGAILSAFDAAFASDTSGIGADPFSLRVVGPDNTIYDPSFSTAQPPDGTVTPGTNQLVRPDGSTQALPDDDGEFDLPMQPAPSLGSNAVGTALPGDRGPFRRVSTRRNSDGSGDYRGGTGTFYLPSATVSAAAVTAHGDSPVIYLGISGGTIEVDAGLAYQNGTHSWALEMQVAGKLVSSQGNPPHTIIPTPLENAPTQYQRFAPGSSIIMSYWAWGRYPTTGRAKLSLLLVDDPYTDPVNPIAAALGAPGRYLQREENVRVKRVHAIAQNAPGVFRTGTSVDGASWSQGSVFLPNAAGSIQGWSSADGTLPGDDGYYDGGNASVTAYETSPYIQEDNINIDIGH